MARINIEDSIYRDERFYKLAVNHGKAKAIGLCVLAWDLAHRYYLKHPENLIPFNEWDKETELNLIENVGLAERRDNGVYVKGSEKECNYLLKRSESGKRGGLKSQENFSSKRKQIEQNQPSSSSSISKKEKDTCDSVESHPKDFPIEDIYKAYPKRLGASGKGKGMVRLSRLITSQADFDSALNAVMCYSKFCSDTKKVKTELVKMFSSFWDANGDWREWINYNKKQSAKPSMDFKREYP